MRHLPIRWRLTAWYATLLLVVLLLFGVGIYGGLRWRLSSALDNQLAAEAGTLLTTVQAGENGPALPPNIPIPAPSDEYFVRLFDDRGDVVIGGGLALATLAAESNVIQTVLDGRTRFTTSRVNDDELVRIISVPVRLPADSAAVSGVLQVARSIEDIDEAIAAVVWALAIATPGVLAVATAGGYLLAGRALAPVASITTLAANVEANDLETRLNLDLPDDEIGRLAATFDAMLERIGRSFEQQRRFTTDAAHELRTPLSLMRGQIDLALSQVQTPDQYRTALQRLDTDVSRLTALVSSLLALARSDAGQIEVSAGHLDLAATVGLVLDQYGVPARQAGVALVDERRPAGLESDEDLIIQVLVNLLDNALAHTPAGGAVAVGCRREDPYAAFWVRDTGSGIAPDHQPHVFDRFYRVETARSRSDGGLGLGLGISRAIVEALGGTIELSSLPGEGTRVVVRLPDSQ